MVVHEDRMEEIRTDMLEIVGLRSHPDDDDDVHAAVMNNTLRHLRLALGSNPTDDQNFVLRAYVSEIDVKATADFFSSIANFNSVRRNLALIN